MNDTRAINPAFSSGYRLNGDYFIDERTIINKPIEGTKIHSLKLVIDKKSGRSTKIFLDENYVGAFQEHFVARLKGGVFVLNSAGSVGLFQNFQIKGCNTFDEVGGCLDGMNFLALFANFSSSFFQLSKCR